MKYGLRKLNRDGIHRNFQWPMEVGAIVKCEDWNEKPECGGGLHFLPEAHGDWNLLDGEYWCVIEYDETKAVNIDNDKSKVAECKIVYLSEDADGIKEYFPDWKPDNSEWAYLWALNIGDREEMKQYVNEQQWAYYWARDIGDKEEMKQYVRDSGWAYCWAMNIGDQEEMKQYVKDSYWAYCWALKIGDREEMKQYVNESEWAYYWALKIGDREEMKQYIKEPKWAYYWALYIGDREEMKTIY